MTKKTKNKPVKMLEIWTIYDHPRDFPDNFVARKFLNDMPTDEILVASNLLEIRELIQNLSSESAIPIASPSCRIARSPEDDPNIVESWL